MKNTKKKYDKVVLRAEPTLAVKYRPRTLDDLVGQEDVIAQVNGMLKRGSVPNTLLITGDTGTGKTTTARIIARTINGFSPDVESHPDIREMNMGDERKIEDIRDLLQQIRFLPTQGRFKTFIFDEAHQLTQQAASAMLKPLEEPPKHVVFIMATNEPHRLLPTIRDRAETLTLKAIPPKAMIPLLIRAAEGERAFMPPAKYKPIYRAVAEASGGSARRALSIFGKLINIHAEKPIRINDNGDIDAAMADVMRALDINVEKVAVLILVSLYRGKGAALTGLGDTQDYQNLVMQLCDLNTFLIERKVGSYTWPSYARKILTEQIDKQGVELSLDAMAIVQSDLVELRQRILMATTSDRHVAYAGIASLLAKLRRLLGKGKDKG